MTKDIFRKQVAGFRPYVPGKPIEEVRREYGLDHIDKLASNENQLGPSPKAMQAIIDAVPTINQYPEASAYELKNALAKKLGVSEKNLVLGNGGEELLNIIAETIINEGDEVVVGEPSFSIYSTTCSLLGARMDEINFAKGQFTVEALFAAVDETTKMIYVCNPNNPTGSIITEKDLYRFIDYVPEDVVIVLDEAYYEFAIRNPEYPAHTIDLLKDHKNIIILRTFSKVYGLAGLRIGYVITSEEIAANMNKIKLSFNCNRLAQVAALAALEDDEHVKRTVDQNYRSLERMYKCFEEMGLEYYPSSANFVWVSVPMHSKIVFEEMMKRGVITRPSYLWGRDNWLRVSTGTDEQTERFCQVFKEVCGK